MTIIITIIIFCIIIIPLAFTSTDLINLSSQTPVSPREKYVIIVHIYKGGGDENDVHLKRAIYTINYGLDQSVTFRFRNFSVSKLFHFFWWYRFRKIVVSKKVSVFVSKNFGIEKSIGIGFEIFWYRKKYWYRFRKNLVSIKLSLSVSKKLGIRAFFWPLSIYIGPKVLNMAGKLWVSAL